MERLFVVSLRHVAAIVIALLCVNSYAQTINGVNTNGSSTNAIVTGVPFLNITPDSRSGAMGETGVALAPDVNANYWNPSKLAFIENNDALALSYSPWLHHLVPDVSLSYLSYAHRINDRNSFGVSMRYFNLGSIELVDVNQQSQGNYTPNEFSIDGSFARKFGNNFSLGLTLRYIHSSLYSSAVSGGGQASPVNDIAADVSLYYRKPGELFGKQSQFAFGTNISNIGPRINYTDGGQKYYLPTNLKIGAAETVDIDALNRFTFAFDINKLLVPTPPIRDSNGDIVKGKNDDKSVPAAIFGSFSDAPGGFSEELKEISFSPGIEYWYNQQFALRAGYFYENPTKGDRQYLTLGAGLRYHIFDLDFAYLAASQQKSPLANTLRFTLLVNFESGKKK